MHSTHVSSSARSTPTHNRRPLRRRPYPKRDNRRHRSLWKRRRRSVYSKHKPTKRRACDATRPIMHLPRVWASSSRKRRRKRRRRRKSPREGSARLTKFFKVPNSWFKLRPMANQRKTWDREDRKRRYGVRVVDTERPSWLLNLNEPRDVDEHSARLVQLSEADVSPARRLRRERRWFRRERRRKRRYRARGVDTERPSWLLNFNELRDVDDELPPRDVDDERPSWLLNLNEPRDHAQRTATAVQWWGKLMDTNLGERSCYVAGRRRRVLPNGPMWRRCGHEQTAAIFRIVCSTIGSSQSEEQFGFHARRIVARLRIRAASSTIKKTMLRRWALRQFKFNASLGYPGEGPSSDESQRREMVFDGCNVEARAMNKTPGREHVCPNEWCRRRGKSFTQRCHLTRHKKRCQDKRVKRTFACPVCAKPFARRAHLERHAGKCKLCDYCAKVIMGAARFAGSQPPRRATLFSEML